MILNFAELYKVPYLLFFIPLIASVLNLIFENKKFSVNITTNTILLEILMILFICIPFLQNDQTIFVKNKINFMFLGAEFKIDLVNLTFLLFSLFIQFITFFTYNYEVTKKKNIPISHRKFFFAIFLIHIFMDLY